MAELSKRDLGAGRWVHLVAIGGTGMGALAALLQEAGWRVTGSDLPLYPPMSVFLANRKIPLASEFSAKNLEGSRWGFDQAHPDLVIVGNAISRQHVEAVAVEELLSQKKIKERLSFAAALAEFAIRDRRSFVVAGTHGKTTTTSLFAWALEALKLQPGFFIGGIPLNFGFGCRMGEGNVFVSEGDEYDTAYWDKESKFLHYRPAWVLCTGIEFDHADIYSSVEAIEESFLKLTKLTKEGWVLIDAESAPRASSVERVAQALKAQGQKTLRYGKAAGSDFQLLGARPVPHPTRPDERGIELHFRSSAWGETKLFSTLIGEHNALNALGVIATLWAAGLLPEAAAAQEFLLGFGGVKRRQEEVSRGPQVTVIDDFAHHPTAIRETIRAIRGRYPQAKIAAFFEARSATSARKVMAKDFALAFDEADAVFLVPPTKTNVPADQKLDIEALARDLRARPTLKDALVEVQKDPADLARTFHRWREARKPERVVALVMSNGPFGGIHAQLQG